MIITPCSGWQGIAWDGALPAESCDLLGTATLTLPSLESSRSSASTSKIPNGSSSRHVHASFAFIRNRLDAVNSKDFLVLKSPFSHFNFAAERVVIVAAGNVMLCVLSNVYCKLTRILCLVESRAHFGKPCRSMSFYQCV